MQALELGTAVIVLSGTGEQYIKDLHNTFDYSGNIPALRIDKPSGIVKVEGTVTVNNYIEFVNGIVYPAEYPASLTSQNDLLSSENHFLLNSFATVTGASDASYCNGAIRCRTGKSIILSIGKGGKYRPAEINAISGVSPAYSSLNTYTAENGSFDYIISNNQGKEVYKGMINSNQLTRMDTSNLAPDSYFVTVYLDNERVTERIIISK